MCSSKGDGDKNCTRSKLERFWTIRPSPNEHVYLNPHVSWFSCITGSYPNQPLHRQCLLNAEKLKRAGLKLTWALLNLNSNSAIIQNTMLIKKFGGWHFISHIAQNCQHMVIIVFKFCTDNACRYYMHPRLTVPPHPCVHWTVAASVCWHQSSSERKTDDAQDTQRENTRAISPSG